MKLVYDVKSAKEYDENAVYYIAGHGEGEQILDALYRLDVISNTTQKLLDIQKKEKEKSSVFAIAMYVMFVSLLIAFAGMAAAEPGMTTLGLFGVVCGLIAGLLQKANKD